MKAYSTREVADLLGISVQRVRGLVRSGVVAPHSSTGGRFTFSFQDLVLLRTAKGLDDAKLPPRRILSALKALVEQLPADRPLSAVRVQIDGDRVIVRDNSTSWEPESGQTVLDFSVREIGDKVAPLARESVQQALHAAENPDELFHAALESEQIGSNADAEAAYRAVIEAEPAHVAAKINLGRLRHIARDLRGSGAALPRSARSRAEPPDRAVQPRRRARGWRRDRRRHRAVPRSRTARSARRGRAFQSRAAVSAGRRRASGAAALLAFSGAHARPQGLSAAPAARRAQRQRLMVGGVWGSGSGLAARAAWRPRARGTAPRASAPSRRPRA